jgi:uncharacterized protein (TIGR02246 family)
MDNDEQAIRALISTWMEAGASGDSARVLELMTEDVVFLGAGRPPMTKADFAAASRTMEGQRVEGTAEIQEVRVFGDWAYCWNQLHVTIHPPGDGHTRHLRGPALSVLRKAADGSWAIVRDANMVTPQPVSETDLSEHYGDCTPGGAVRIETSDVNKLNRELSIKDPFGNRVIFYQPI